MRHRPATASSDLAAAFDRVRHILRGGAAPDHHLHLHSALPAALSAASYSSPDPSPSPGLQLHALALRAGLLSSPFVTTSLVALYARRPDPAAARGVLDSAPAPRDPAPWNALLAGLSRRGLFPDALDAFVEMRQRGLVPDEFTLPPALNSAALLSNSPTARSLHSLILRSGLQSHLHVSNALIDAYAKLGAVTCAHKVFDHMPHRDVVTWTSLLTGLARSGSHDSALGVYYAMLRTGVEPDEFATAAVLSSCAGSTALDLGRQVHSAAVRTGFDSFLSVANSLVSMYAKTGSIDDARTVFDAMRRRCPITWTALIVGYAQNGRGRDSLAVYEDMIRTGCRPDYVTFIGLLFACSHAGLVGAGRAHFDSMERVYRITPGPDHYACMVDLLGRSGRLEEAAELLSRMRTGPDPTVWKALLGACRVHRNVELGERAAEMVFRLDPTDAVPYVMLSNLYSRARRWDDVARIRGLLRARGAIKEPGYSWVGVGPATHVFRAGERGHERTAEIYRRVEEMMGRIREEEGYVADTDWALQDEDAAGRERGLAHHSERLAVAFGLLELPRGAPIRVYKNLRVCGDCHVAIKLVAKVYARVIVLRDANCFHHMRDGVCSCGEYW
ncbi:putative pentatricopeptide repeat-containing protein At5g52630 [Ananas comosus]|uniref:Pentatricopeptide repeat-containing protein At5g52630 n=1 Tax=Ananas comosus TaxID=4615 RepID=A0A6P5EXT5_ANACO|nr:putative pentatricopeptide repeat-containing protein At5g52630 [Ananas comosus]